MKIVMRIVLLLICVLQLQAQEVFFTIKFDSTNTGSGSSGRGTGYGILSNDRKTLRYDFTVNNLQGTISAAHFHYSPTGGVVHAITLNGNSGSGVWENIPDSLTNALFSGDLYLNVHTSAFAGGEIRGNMEPRQSAFPLLLNGTQAGTSSTGHGSGYIVLDRHEESPGVIKNYLSYRFTYAGLSAVRSGVHFHSLADGGVVHSITMNDSTAEESWEAPDNIYTLLLHKKLYLNIHTSVNPGGEIRANTGILVGEIPLVGTINGSQASTASSAQGTVWAVLRPDLTVKYSATFANLQGNFSAAHFHTANGGAVVNAVTFTGNHTSGDWTGLTDANLVDLIKGKIYLNIHSSTSPGGEIRGNLYLHDGALVGILDGTQAGTASSGKGTIWITFYDDSVEYHVTIAGLQGTFSAAHFHVSPSGNVAFPLTFTNGSAGGFWSPQEKMLDLINGNIYINVHSSSFPGGEIRSNLKMGTGIATEVSLHSVIDQVPLHLQLNQNYPNPFNPTTTLSFELPNNSIVTLKVFDMLGREVATLLNEPKNAGSYTVQFNATHLSSGIYYAKLQSGNNVQVKKMLLLK